MLHFYAEILGCQIERETPSEVGLTQLRAGSSLIDLVTVDGQLGQKGGGPPSSGERNMDHFCLSLEPVSEQDIRHHLAIHGIEVGEFAPRYGAEGQMPSVYIQDPEGNTLELRSRKTGGQPTTQL